MKTVLITLLAAFSASVGETFLSYGMSRIGQADWNARAITGWLVNVFTCPQIIVGILFLACFFFLYLIALARADLSFVLPLTAASFVFAAILAKIFLREEVSFMRWLGVAVIIIGITLVGAGSRQRTVTVDDGRAGQKNPAGQGQSAR